MATFKNKKTKKTVEVNLNYYVELMKNNPDYKEVKEKETSSEKDNKEVEEPLQ